MTYFVTVSDGSNSTEIQFTYRWWVAGRDPWRESVSGGLAGSSGDWFFAGIGRVGAFQVYGTPRGGSSSKWMLTLRTTRGDIGDVQVGDSGTGLNYITTGGTVGDPVEWECTRIA